MIDPDLALRRRTCCGPLASTHTDTQGRSAIVRLVDGVLAEQTDERAECRRYLGLEVRARCRITIVPITEPEIGAAHLPRTHCLIPQENAPLHHYPT